MNKLVLLLAGLVALLVGADEFVGKIETRGLTFRLNFMNKLVLLLVGLVALSGFADEFVGKVTKVSDGDTIWVMTESGREKVRMDRIDAPEKNQKFGKEASAILAEMIDGKEVRVEWKKRDQYGRILGIVFEGETDVNLEMIRKGAAWHYSYFDKTANYAEAEKAAKEAKIGLWKELTPINPHEWRKRGSRKGIAV